MTPSNKRRSTEAKKNGRWFERHRFLTLLIVNFIFFVFILFTSEVFLRFYIPYNPGYYVSVRTTSQELEYPWGKVPVNKYGYPDSEFSFDNKPRIGYFGDSVNFGVGAGYGHRISEYLESAYPDFAHWNFGRIGEALSSDAVSSNFEITEKFKLSKLVYLFNLNDIMPDVTTSTTNVRKYQEFVWKYLDWLRGRSYLYSFIRTKVKNYLAVRGFEASGYEASELFPTKNLKIVKGTAERVNKLYRSLNKIGVSLYIIIMPYEMQISDEAARTYKASGITWEDGFLTGSTQKMLMKYIVPDVNIYNAYGAFIHQDEEKRDKAKIRVGEYFVYNRGDKMDWNHPTGKGHKKIANYLVNCKIFQK